MLQQSWTNSIAIPPRRIRPTWEELLCPPRTKQKTTQKQSDCHAPSKIDNNTVKPEPAPPGPDPEATPTGRTLFAPPAVPQNKRPLQKQKYPETDPDATPTGRMLQVNPAVIHKEVEEQKKNNEMHLSLHSSPSEKLIDALSQKKVCSFQNFI